MFASQSLKSLGDPARLLVQQFQESGKMRSSETWRESECPKASRRGALGPQVAGIWPHPNALQPDGPTSGAPPSTPPRAQLRPRASVFVESRPGPAAKQTVPNGLRPEACALHLGGGEGRAGRRGRRQVCGAERPGPRPPRAPTVKFSKSPRVAPRASHPLGTAPHAPPSSAVQPAEATE